MEDFSGLIAVLLEHSQRFFDIWNLQIVIALGVLGFSLTNQKIISKVRVRLLISAVFIAIAAFSVFSLASHQKREERLWNVLEARVAAPGEYIPEEVAYIDALKPTRFDIKAGALVAADVLIILVIWFSPKMKE